MRFFRCAACGAFNRLGWPPPADRAAVCGSCRGRLDLRGTPQAVDAAGLDRAVRSSPVPVLVDFWAAWCGPCRAAAPIFEEVGQRRAGQLTVLKVNVDEAPEAAERYQIRGVPTFLLLHRGRPLARQAGVMSRDALERWVDAATHGQPAASV